MSESELELQKINDELRAEVEDLKRQLADFKRLIFGKKNERFVPTDDAQASLFETSQVETAVEEEDAVAITYERTKPPKDKQKPIRTELPAHLPREEQIIEPEDKPEGLSR